MLADNPQFETERKVAQDSLDELHRQGSEQPADLSFVVEQPSIGPKAWRRRVKRTERRRIWQGIINLYAK